MQKVWAWRGAKQATIRATNNKASISVCDFSRDVILFFLRGETPSFVYEKRSKASLRPGEDSGR